jgi:hypothetical protein
MSLKNYKITSTDGYKTTVSDFHITDGHLNLISFFKQFSNNTITEVKKSIYVNVDNDFTSTDYSILKIIYRDSDKVIPCTIPFPRFLEKDKLFSLFSRLGFVIIRHKYKYRALAR